MGKTFYQKWQEVSTYYEITLGKNKVRNQDTTYVFLNNCGHDGARL